MFKSFLKATVTVLFFFLVVVFFLPNNASAEESRKLNLAIIWHQHQPLYKDTATGTYRLPWARVHAVQEYFDSPLILNEYPGIDVTFNLVPSLIDQIADYGEISNEEMKRGGVFEYIGASDPHLELALTPPGQLTEEERKKIEEEFFWLNPYPLDDDGDDPYYSARYSELKSLSEKRALTDEEITDLAALFFLWQISPRLHEEYGLASLRERKNYSREDVIRVIEAQRRICADLLEYYKKADANGSEIITSPYYHPILPLLMSDGWEGVDKDPWEEDTLVQLREGVKRYEEVFDHKPSGLWPPETAVSQAIVGPVAEAGYTWFVSDESVLEKSRGKTVDLAELTRPYHVISQARKVNVIFREPDLSNKIGLSYGNKPTEYAVNDLLNRLKEIYDELDNPDEHLLTIALDGENWMFMAEYPNNGRSFLELLYKKLGDADWINTTTPEKYLDERQEEPKVIHDLATGSWAGDLTTWRGEPEEDRAWRWLIDARRVERASEEGPKSSKALQAAEGSDWFWWYGTDQDSGNDETFDGLFKTHLINVYRRSGTSKENIPQALFVEKVPPVTGTPGKVSPEVDGTVTGEDEWKESLNYQIDDNMFKTVRIGYGPNNFFVRVDTRKPSRELIGEDVSICLYFTGEKSANSKTNYGSSPLGFGASQIVALHLEDVGEDGKWNVFRYEADGSGGWKFASDISDLERRKAAVDEIVEVQFPLETVGIEPEENFFLRLGIERRGTGKTIRLVPEKPVRMKIPKPISGQKVVSLADPVGDDVGPGTYTYPNAPVFDQDGLFDLRKYEIYDAGNRWVMTFDFGAMTNPWAAPYGFSHQLINLYLDVEDGGRTETYKQGANVKFPPEYGWDYFIKVTGWPDYGRELVTAEGDEFKVDVSSDPKKNRVIVEVPKELVPKVRGGGYLLILSQDGYGRDHIRDVREESSTWQGGGSPEPSLAPNVYDYLDPDGDQKAILGNYDANENEFVTLRPYKVGDN